MIRMPLNKAVKSKGMLAGFFMIALGLYVIVGQEDTTGGMTIMALGFGFLGIRDAK